MPTNRIIQKYIDVEVIEGLKQKVGTKFVSTADSELKMDLLIALDILKECFNHNFVERKNK